MNYIELAKKLKALADRGVGGERVNAQAMLDKMLKEKKISHADLEENIAEKRTISVPLKRAEQVTDVAMACIRKVLGASARAWWTGPAEITIECTHAERAEIQILCDIYIASFEKHLETFVYGFIIKNDIFPKDAGDQPRQALTYEERVMIGRARQMAEVIRKEEILKRLG